LPIADDGPPPGSDEDDFPPPDDDDEPDFDEDAQMSDAPPGKKVTHVLFFACLIASTVIEFDSLRIFVYSFPFPLLKCHI
jgi:hypothetical protein